MAANLITRSVTAREFLGMLNSRSLARYFRLAGREMIVEFDITNNTVLARVHDPLKAQKVQDGMKVGSLNGNLPPYQRKTSVLFEL